MAGASNLQREAYDYENGLLTNHLALVQIFIDGTANGLSWFGLFLSIRATLPVLNGLVLPKAPEAVTDQLVPFLRITCDRYLSIFQRIFPYNITGVDLAVFPAFVCTLPTPLKAAQLSRTLADFSLSTSHTNKHTQMHTRTRTRSTEPFAAALNCSCRSFPSLISLFTFVRFFLATHTLLPLSPLMNRQPIVLSDSTLVCSRSVSHVWNRGIGHGAAIIEGCGAEEGKKEGCEVASNARNSC